MIMDYILREVSKTQKAIETVLKKIGLFSVKGEKDQIKVVVRHELLQRLDIDIDKLLKRSDLVKVLIENYNFTNEDLDKFGEIIYSLLMNSDDNEQNRIYARAVQSINRYLDRNGCPYSLNRCYMLSELSLYF